MCGFFGIINFSSKNVDIDKSQSILELLHHRGPDGRGYFYDHNIYLGHRRLSIIDLEGGDQPLYNENKDIVLIGNGEIYNYKELRNDLIQRGHKFRTHSDSEVIVHLFEDEREECLARLNGMFAIAVYDVRNRSLFLARDRIGIKPLYYYFDDKQFVFSSEIKAIVKSRLIPVDVDYKVVYQFLTLHHSVPPNTLIQGIKSLRAGHYMYIKDRPGEQITYWDIKSNLDSEVLSYQDAYERVEHMLLDSVEKRLMSDVPLGLFLSGGIDSSLIAVLMHRIVGDGIKTFSIGFKEREFSELPYSQRVSRMIASDHTEIIVAPQDIMDNIGNVVWYRETPISEVSDIPIYLLSKEASRKVKVVLTGEGGDEVFCGYRKYVFEEITKYLRFVSNPIFRAIFNNRMTNIVLPERLISALGLMSEGDRYKRYYRWFSFFREEELRNILREDKLYLLDNGNVFADLIGGKRFRENLDEMQYFDFRVWLPDNLLLRGDRMSMASGLEARVPFLDHRIVELSFLMPKRLKVRNFQGKYIIKKIAEKYLDKNIIYRKKIGFEVPVGQWFRNELKDYLIEKLTQTNSFIHNMFLESDIKSLINDHIEHKMDNRKKLWMLLNLELWYEQFVRN